MFAARRITDKCMNPENMINRLTHGMSWHYMMRMKRYSIMQQMADKIGTDEYGEILIYQTDDGQTNIEVKIEDDTVWLTQQ